MANCPLLFEALPPQVESSEEQWQDHLDLLDPLKKAGLTAVNVPEIVNGHYRTVDPRSFASALQRRLNLRAIVNRITVHHSLHALKGWVAETRLGTGIQDFVLVGGESSTQQYPGASVTDALQGLRPAVEKGGGSLGVITIAHRRRKDNDEPQRLLAKQAAGASFAVSQILADADAAVRLQHDLAAATAPGTLPLTLFWSLAPVAKARDIEFLQWLGVQIPDVTKARLLAPATAGQRLAASHTFNEGLARTLLEAAESDGLPAPGFCIEHVMLSNIDGGIELVDRIRSITRDFGKLKQAAYPVAKAW